MTELLERREKRLFDGKNEVNIDDLVLVSCQLLSAIAMVPYAGDKEIRKELIPGALKLAEEYGHDYVLLLGPDAPPSPDNDFSAYTANFYNRRKNK